MRGSPTRMFGFRSSSGPAGVSNRLCSVIRQIRCSCVVSSRGTLFAGFVSLPFDDDAAWHYADIRHQLETAGCVIGPNDFKIAAICRANSLTLVTSNTAEFSRVPNLAIEDWSNPA